MKKITFLKYKWARRVQTKKFTPHMFLYNFWVNLPPFWRTFQKSPNWSTLQTYPMFSIYFFIFLLLGNWIRLLNGYPKLVFPVNIFFLPPILWFLSDKNKKWKKMCFRVVQKTQILIFLNLHLGHPSIWRPRHSLGLIVKYTSYVFFSAQFWIV